LVAIRLVGLCLLASCGQDPDIIRPVEAPHRAAVALEPLTLNDHDDFDRLDAWAGAQVLKVYHDLMQVAPDHRLVRVRAVHAALMQGSGHVDQAIDGLRKRWPSDPDVQYLVLLQMVARLRGEDGLLHVTRENKEEAESMLQTAAFFIAEHPEWVGPAGADCEAVERMLFEVLDGLASLHGDGMHGPADPPSES